MTKRKAMLGVVLKWPFHRSAKGNVNLMVFVDYLTHWVEFYTLRKVT